nr:MAG: hypothetical protein [Microvirus sp.]
MGYNKNGEEVLDPTPIEVPIGLKKPMSLQEKMKLMVRQEMSVIAQANGMESFEEADDFDCDDDTFDAKTPWEEDFDPDVPFIGEKEAAIRHGVVSDIDEEKIAKGVKAAEELKAKRKEIDKQAAIAARKKRKKEREYDDDDYEDDLST